MQRRIVSVRRPMLALQTAGIAALEFALLAPLFLIVLAGAFDIGTALYTQVRLEAAIAAGANYALLHASEVLTNAASLNTEITNIVTSNTAGTAPGVTVLVNNNSPNLWYCPLVHQGSRQLSWDWGTNVTLGTICADKVAAGKFVTITAAYSYAPYFSSYYGIGLRSGTMTAAAMVQTQ